MKRANLSPAQLALLCILGGGLAACSFFVLAPLEANPPVRYVHVAVSFVLGIIGFVLWLKSISTLKDGIKKNRWPPESIERLGNVLDSLLLRILTAGLILSAVCIGAFSFFHGPRMVFAWPPLILGQILMQLQQATRSAPSTRPPFHWRNFNPLRSEHWGDH